MGEDLGHGQTGLWLELYHSSDQSLGLCTQLAREVKLSLQNELVEVFQVTCLERYSSAEHGKEQYTQRPYINKEPFVPLINDDLGGEISWGSALLLDHLALLYYFGNTEIANLYSLFAVQ